MSLLVPLGLLGLIGLIILILIYLIKPNYQNKQVSSTFMWRLSLKYEKKRIPISKIKNLLILLCQILIIVLCALLLAVPALVQASAAGDEAVLVIDASAGMLATGSEDTNRFERAVEEARGTASQIFDKGGRVSVILADGDADFIIYRANSDSRKTVDDALIGLVDDEACTYGAADIDGAMTLANDVVSSAEEVQVILYTCTEYGNSGSVTVRNMSLSDGSEWNVAVLDCRAELNENNMYVFYVDLACYGRDVDVEFTLNVAGINNTDRALTYRISRDPLNPAEKIRLSGNRATTVVVNSENVVPNGEAAATSVFSFTTATVSVQVNDSLVEDNLFSLYGNVKPVMNIQYVSARPNSFFSAAFLSLANALQNRWTVNIREVRPTSGVAQLSGFDLYVFEDMLPETMPSDGVVFLVNPSYAPSGSEFGIGSVVSLPERTTLTAGEEHPVINNVYPQNIDVTRYNPIILSQNSGFVPLLYCQGSPVLVSKNTDSRKVIVMSFSLNYSSAAMSYDFPRLILNIVNHFIPSTFIGNVYNVNDEVVFTPRGPRLDVSGGGQVYNFDEFPASIVVKRVGTYSVTQTPISNIPITENFFVRIPKEESNICRKVDVLENQISPNKRQISITDLCVYFAAALVALIVAERLLQSRSMG